MNPYQHSDVAAAIYNEIYLLFDDLDFTSQDGMGILACRIADMMVKKFDVELQEAPLK